MTSEVAGPIQRGERIEVLDVLRGAAIFGILIANMLVVSGYYFLTPEEQAALPTAASDGIVIYLIHVLLEGKFYSIFSLLFGIGFAVQLGRSAGKGTAFPALFRRRLSGLLLIGLVHAVFIWSGDILLLYALLGFLLIPFHRASDRTLLVSALTCLALPVLIYLLLLALSAGDPFATMAGATAEGDGPDFFATMLAGFRGTNWLDAWKSNLMMLAGRWVDLFITMRFPKVFGMFLLGLYLGRSGVGLDAGRDRGLLRRIAVVGIAIGVPANLLMAYLQEMGVYLPASGPGLLQVVVAAIGVPLLALGYAASLVLVFHSAAGRRLLAPLGWAGRMALTNYLMHSVIMVAIFYGIGLGWYGRLGPMMTTALALLICLVQVPLSRAWLQRFQFGPVEWLWRQFTYRRAIPLRRPAVPA